MNESFIVYYISANLLKLGLLLTRRDAMTTYNFDRYLVLLWAIKKHWIKGSEYRLCGSTSRHTYRRRHNHLRQSDGQEISQFRLSNHKHEILMCTLPVLWSEYIVQVSVNSQILADGFNAQVASATGMSGLLGASIELVDIPDSPGSSKSSADGDNQLFLEAYDKYPRDKSWLRCLFCSA